MPDPSRNPDTPVDPRQTGRERLLLARKWAYVLLSNVYLPMTQGELERELLTMVNTVCDVVHSEPFDTRRAGEAGTRLVELGCLANESLRCTIEVVGKGLLSRQEFAPTGRFAERIVLTLGALTCGFAEANRNAVLEQQENMQRSLIKAVRDTRWSLQESEARFDKVVASSTSGILITDLDGRLIRSNTAVCDILGYSTAELRNRTLFDLVHPDYAPALRESYRELSSGKQNRIRQSHRLLRKDGDDARISLTASLLRGAEERPVHFVTVIEDGTELMLLQSELSRQALHDVLTGLPNRQSFCSHIATALRRADPAHGVTLFHLDLDAFSMISDGLGRHIGDQVLVNVARRLTTIVAGEKATVGRLGGDEFGIIVENSATTPSSTAMVGQINDKLAELAYVDGHSLAVSACIAVVDHPRPDTDPAELLRAADLTLRRVKATGRGQWAIYHPDQDARDRRTYTLATQMPGAWDNGEISVVYRPVTRLADGRTAGIETLLRWNHPDLGELNHNRCLELAEQTGLILPLGEWLLRTTCQQIAWWRLRHEHFVPVIVGLTSHQSSDSDLVSRVLDVLDATALPARHLMIGMPVDALSVPDAADNLGVLADIGVRTLLDNFGTAPEELAILEDLTVRSIRIAPRLVERQAESAEDSPLMDALRAIAPLVHRAEATIIVDGLRSRDQANWWRETGADLATGDLFGTACPPGEMLAHLGNSAPIT